MTVRLLKAILAGLPESSSVTFIRRGEIIDVDIVGITQLERRPVYNKFNTIKESVVLSDMETLNYIDPDKKIKRVWRYMPDKEAV